MKNKKIIFVKLAIIVSLFLLFIATQNLFSLYIAIDPTETKLSQKIEKIIHKKVTIGNAKINILKGLSIILENVAIADEPESAHFITSDRFTVTFYLLPLLKKQLVIKEIRIMNPVLQVYRDKKGDISIIKWINGLIPHQEVSDAQSKNILFSAPKKFIINNGRLIIRDYYFSNSPLITTVSDLSLEIKRKFFKKTISGLIQGEIIGKNQPGIFKITSEIKNKSEQFNLEDLVSKGNIVFSSMDINHFQPYFEQFAIKTEWKGYLDAHVNYEGSLARGIKSVGAVKFNSFGFSPKIGLIDPQKIHRWKLIYRLLWNKNKLEFYDVEINLNDLLLKGNFFIDEPFSKNPLVNVEFKNISAETKTPIGALPLGLLPEPIRLYGDKLIKGNIRLNSIKFHGNIAQIKNIHQINNFNLLTVKLGLDNVDVRASDNGPVFKNVNGMIEFIRGAIKISHFSGAYKNSRISELSLEILSPFEKPVINLKTKALLQLKQIHPLLLEKNSPFNKIIPSKKIKEMSGKAKIKINLSGRAEQPTDLIYSGEIEFMNLALVYDGLKHDFTDITGQARFYSQSSLIPEKDKEMTLFLKSFPSKKIKKGEYLYIAGLSGKYGNSQAMNISGGIFLDPTTPVIDLKIHSDLDLKEIYSLLASNLNANKNLKKWSNINIISGRTKVKAKIKGFSPRIAEWDLSGQMHLEDVYVSHEKVKLIPSSLKGSLFFSKDEIRLEDLTGLFGKSAFSLSGKVIDYSSKYPKLDLMLNSEFTARNILNILKLTEDKNYHIDGVANLNLIINGSYHEMFARSELNLTKSTYHFKEWIEKKKGKKAIIFLDGELKNLNTLHLRNLELILGKNKILGNGVVVDFNNPYIDLRLKTIDLDIAEATELTNFLTNHLITGKLTSSFNLKGYLYEKKPFKIEGMANLRESSYKFGFSPNKIKNINADIDFSNQKVVIDNGVFFIDKSEANIHGEIENLSNPIFTLALKSKNLDLNSLFSNKENSIKETNKLFKNSPFFHRSRGKILLDVDKGAFGFLKFPRFVGEIQIKDGSIIFNKVNVFFKKNYLTGDALLNFASDYGLNFSLNIIGQSIPAEDFENIFQKYFKESITGELNITAHLTGKGFNLKQITKSLSGDLSLLLTKGDYNKHKLISGIKQIIGSKPQNMEENLPDKRDKRAEFDLIRGNFIINQGVAVTENYTVETSKRKMSLIGKFDLGNKNLDLAVGIAPWSNLNKAMLKIPLAGRILTGKNKKSLLISYYNVKGKMGSPKVTPVPLKSLGKKVISLLKGVLETPKEIFAPTQNN